MTGPLLAGDSLHTVSRFVHHTSTTVTEQSYEKRTYREIVERMIIPLQWNRGPEASSGVVSDMAVDKDDINSEETSSVNRLAAAALLEEMKRCDDLRRENEFLKTLLFPDQQQQLAAFHEAPDQPS